MPDVVAGFFEDSIGSQDEGGIFIFFSNPENLVTCSPLTVTHSNVTDHNASAYASVVVMCDTGYVVSDSNSSSFTSVCTGKIDINDVLLSC